MTISGTNHIDVVVCGERINDGLGHRLGNVELFARHGQTAIDDDEHVLGPTRRGYVPIANARIVVVVEAGKVSVPFASRIETNETRARAEILPPKRRVHFDVVFEHFVQLFRVHDRVYRVLIVARYFVRYFHDRFVEADLLFKIPKRNQYLSNFFCCCQLNLNKNVIESNFSR